jgi:DNA-directed RNA polymerase beta' subunit
MNMMGHKAKIVENNTFKLNVFVCKSYNADFDGKPRCHQQAGAYQVVC